MRVRARVSSFTRDLAPLRRNPGTHVASRRSSLDPDLWACATSQLAAGDATPNHRGGGDVTDPCVQQVHGAGGMS